MVGDGSVMSFLFQLVLLFLLLLVLAFATPTLHPILYTAIFLLVFSFIFTTFLMPLSKSLLKTFSVVSDTYLSLFIKSVLLYFISEKLTAHFKEMGYGSLADIGHFAMKVSILLLWLPFVTDIMQSLSTFIK